jgi:hypothetical protein
MAGTVTVRDHARAHVLPCGATGKDAHMLFILWLIAVILVIAGIVRLVRGEALVGIVLIVVGFLVGPGGVSIFA